MRIRYNKVAYAELQKTKSRETFYSHILLPETEDSDFTVMLSNDSESKYFLNSDIHVIRKLSVTKINQLEDILDFCRENRINLQKHILHQAGYSTLIVGSEKDYIIKSDLYLENHDMNKWRFTEFHVDGSSPFVGYTNDVMWNGSHQPVLTKEQVDIMLTTHDPHKNEVMWDEALSGYWVMIGSGDSLKNYPKSDYFRLMDEEVIHFASSFNIEVGDKSVIVYSVTDSWCFDEYEETKPNIIRIVQSFRKGMYDLIEYITDYDQGNSGIEYPFTRSFDEVANDIHEWIYTYAENVSGKDRIDWSELPKYDIDESRLLDSLSDYYCHLDKLKSLGAKQEEIYNSADGQESALVDDLLSFESIEGVMVINPFRTECMRFTVDPLEHYGICFINEIPKWIKYVNEN